jgi:xanthine/CO dehydrogenase XdhC/CoxF family maturation factor
MTHNYSHDALYLKHLLQSPVFYIGLLGPTTKSSMLLQKLQEQGFHPSSEQLGRLYTPVGLDIGAETPEEIALSIIAEIQAVLGERRGGFLKERKAPIH